MNEIKINNIAYPAELRVDSINILLRNDKTINVEVNCDVSIKNMAASYGQARFNFLPDQELIDFLKSKIMFNIEKETISTNMPYLLNLKKDEEKNIKK